MQQIVDSLFARLPQVRYVATYVGGALALNQRPGIENASASESDKYEELIVNPTLLKLLEQRGNIDCGGMQYVVIRYGNFFEFVQPVEGGHISVGFDCAASVDDVVRQIREIVGK